ncbi:MAG: NAD(P)H-binding protein [Anaerolineae bacterium]|nr:NAD(P)H-binding protein [Anaerolineae bacterium]
MQKTILILGGTGMLGAPVARQLQADGFEVRLLARSAEKAQALFGHAFRLFEGDVSDCASLEWALAGCDGVHISVGGELDYRSAENVANLAPRLGVKHITYVSGSTVSEQNGWFPMVQQKLNAESAIRECGVPYTIFCPTWPMEQLPRFVRDGQATVIGELPTPYHWFAADDFGAMVSNAYQREDAVNKRLYVHGPEAIGMKDALGRYCETFYPEVKGVSVMPIAAARVVAVATGNDMLKFAAELMNYFKKVGEPGDPAEANQLLGAPTTTLDAWIAQTKPITA